MIYDETTIQAFEKIGLWIWGLGSASHHRNAADRAALYGGL